MASIMERAFRFLNLRDFEDAGKPEPIGKIFLSPSCSECYILRMPIRVDYGNFDIPHDIAWIAPALKMALAHQAQIGIDHPFVYVTIRHGIVRSQTDDEWHVDGFSTKIPHLPEQNYIWSNENGTEFAPLLASFPSDFDARIHNVNHYLGQFVDKVDKAKDSTLYCVDPYLLHRRPRSSEGTMRTFLRISFVPIEINDINNTPNPNLPRNYTQDGVAFRNSLLTYGETNAS